MLEIDRPTVDLIKDIRFTTSRKYARWYLYCWPESDRNLPAKLIRGEGSGPSSFTLLPNDIHLTGPEAILNKWTCASNRPCPRALQPPSSSVEPTANTCEYRCDAQLGLMAAQYHPIANWDGGTCYQKKKSDDCENAHWRRYPAILPDQLRPVWLLESLN